MIKRSSDEMCRGAVLDIETAPSSDLIGNAGRAGRNGFERPALHRVVCASVLSFQRDPQNGAFKSAGLRTFTSEQHPEAAILVGLNLTLPDPSETGAYIATWNGGFDLQMLRGRGAALWMTDVDRLRAWTTTGGTHLDLMRDGASGIRGWWRLADVCASLGFALHTGAKTMTRSLAEGRWDQVAAHSRLDVLGTLIVHGARETFLRGCPIPAATAWLEAARLARLAGASSVGEAALAGHVLVGVAKRKLQAHDPATCGCGGMGRLAA